MNAENQCFCHNDMKNLDAKLGLIETLMLEKTSMHECREPIL